MWAAMVVNRGPPIFIMPRWGGIFVIRGGACPISIAGMEVEEVIVIKHLQYGRAAQKTWRGQKRGMHCQEGADSEEGAGKR